MREEDDEHSEEPPIPILSRKGKEKVIIHSASEDEAEDIDAELEVVATRVTRTPTEIKHLLDIIAVITGEASAAEKTASATSQQSSSGLLVKLLQPHQNQLL